MAPSKFDWSNTGHFMGESTRDSHILAAYMITDESEELEKIYHLTESHAPITRLKAVHLFEKAKLDASHKVFPIDSDLLQYPCQNKGYEIREAIDNMLMHNEMMPSEWTLVQITSMKPPRYEPSVNTYPLQITVFECGQKKVKPFTVHVPPPKSETGVINIVKDFQALIQEINTGYNKLKDRLGEHFKESYSQFQLRCTNTLKDHVKTIQSKWLAEWRALLMGRFTNQKFEDEIERTVHTLIDELTLDLTEKQQQILRYACKAQGFLNARETKKLLQYCIPDMSKEDIINACKSIKPCETLQKMPRNPVILIVDPLVDEFPWEALDVLESQQVTRMPSFHFTCALYDAHEVYINNGFRMIQTKGLRGGAILNPGKDLTRMENRLASFHKYWMPDWKIMQGQAPTEDEFVEMIANNDVFIYGGHGDGMQFIRDRAKLSKLRIEGVVFTFGCASVALHRVAHDENPQGSSLQYTTCCCPSIVGFLWNVTDYMCDMLHTNFLSYWLPKQKGKTHWCNLDRMKWSSGSENVDIESLPKKKEHEDKHEPNLLLALNMAKVGISEIIKYACVVRGIPIKLE